MGNFISLLLDILFKKSIGPTPTPTPGKTPTPTPGVTSKIQGILPVINEKDKLLEQSTDFDSSIPLPNTSVTDALLDVYNDNIETFVGDYSYIKNTRTNKMSQGIFNRNTDSIVLGSNTFSK
jgi:hypothetical protein